MQLILLSNDVEENPGPTENVHEISIFHLNARSVRNKLDSIQILSHNASVVGITETHLDETIASSELIIPGYHHKIFRNTEILFRGGVMVYIADHLHAERRLDLEFVNGELIWFELTFPRYKILVCVVYRSPGTTLPFWGNFHASLEKAFELSPRILITGDLNVNLLVENNHVLNEIMNICNLKKCISEATR